MLLAGGDLPRLSLQWRAAAMTGSHLVERGVLMRDPTLVARLLLSGAAVELAIVSSTNLRPCCDGYVVTVELESVGITMMQWVETPELESAVRWMITRAVATQDRQTMETTNG